MKESEILTSFANELISEQKDIDNSIVQMVNQNFNELLLKMNIPIEDCLIHKTTNEIVVLSDCKNFIRFADGKLEPFFNSEQYKELPKNIEITKK